MLRRVAVVLVLAGVGFAAYLGGDFDLSWYTIDGGGTESAGERFTIAGTIGQPDAGMMAGGDFSLSGGFRGRRHMQLKFRELPLFGPRVKTDFSVRYRFQTTETFFGLGPDSERVDKSSYGHRYAEPELALALSPGGRTRRGPLLACARNELKAAGTAR